MAIYNTRKSPNPGGLFNLGLNYFQAGNLPKADSLFTAYNTVFPDSVYGYFWRGRTNYQLDTTMIVEPYATNMVQNYQKSLDISFKDKIRYRTQGTQSALLLAGYFNNIKSSRDSALMYVVKGLEIDSTNAQLKNIKEIFDKQPAKGTQKPAGKTTGKPSASLRKPSNKS
jgi:tetratricopeptide (TPR) repeat protein